MPLFSGQAVHFRGLAGSTFVCLAVALVAYVIGFASNSWLVKGGLGGVTVHDGLWQSCTCTQQDHKPGMYCTTVCHALHSVSVHAFYCALCGALMLLIVVM